MKCPTAPVAACALLLASLIAASCRGMSSDGHYVADLSSLVQAEHDFARSAAELGTREAFLAYLSPDAVLFRPYAVSAHAHLQQQPQSSGTLSWQPAFADVSAKGDLGFTTGPWQYHSEPGARPTAHGQYFTFWRRGAEKEWKAVIDHGTVGPQPPLGAATTLLVTPVHLAERWSGDGDPWRWRQSLIETDSAFASALARQDRVPALRWIAANVRVLRNGQAPRVGPEAMLDAHSRGSAIWVWTVGDGYAAASGDLGYTYGEYARSAEREEGEERGIYLRAWRRHANGDWQIVVDLMTPIPPADN